MRVRCLLLGLSGVLVLANAGCKDGDGEDCLGGAELVAGCGASLDGNAIRVGDGRTGVEDAFGAPSSSGDLADLGVRFEYDDVPLSGLFSAADGVVTTVNLRDGFAGSTEGGVGVGSDQATVTDEFGEALSDPVLGMLWYPEAGIAFEIADGKVTRIQIFTPVTG